MLRDLNNQDKQYGIGALEIETMNPNPLLEFRTWLDNALTNKIPDANAMVLATCGKDAQPDARIVLLKQISRSGLVFFTNYQSQKAQQMDQNNKVSATFFWSQLEQQIRIRGTIQKIPNKDSDIYFDNRQRDSRIFAIISPQSTIIENKAELQSQFEKLNDTNMLKRPTYWGGYQITPAEWEFWQGRPNRFNDRVLYKKDTTHQWQKHWLAP